MTSAREIADKLGLPEEDVLESLVELQVRGLIDWCPTGAEPLEWRVRRLELLLSSVIERATLHHPERSEDSDA